MASRFVYRHFDANQMTVIGKTVMDTAIKPRILSGINANDAPAKPLSVRYIKAKLKRGLQPMRDLVWRGLTMRSMRVVNATANKVAIGFDNPEAGKIAAINNARDRMFWFSDKDQKVIQSVVQTQLRSGGNVGTGKA